MIVTEEEAKTKRCQESYAACSQVTIGGMSYAAPMHGGAYAVVTAPQNCLGSACMAWRWVNPNETSNGCVGYCGKAGHP